MNITNEMQAGAGTGTRPSGPPLKGEMTPAGLLGMYLFLASEVMFFVGLLGSFVVLESAGGQHDLFVHSSAMLSAWIVFSSVTMLVLASGLLLNKQKTYPWIAILMGLIFVINQSGQWMMLLSHHTCAVKSAEGVVVFDGSESPDGSTTLENGRRMVPANDFDIHAMTAGDFLGKPEYSKVKNEDVRQDLNYGPSRNNFFACYFLFTAVHVMHLIAGMIALGWYLIFPKPVLRYAEEADVSRDRSGSSEYLRDRRLNSIPAGVQMYWHFVNAVGVIAFAVLYFV